MNIRKIIWSLVFVAIVIFLVSLFWKQTFFLIALIVISSFLKHKIIPIKKEFLLFIISGILASGAENIIIQLSGAWSYPNTQFLNIPLWLLFLWGLVGILGITLYEGITNS